jgi:hypothetical protein
LQLIYNFEGTKIRERSKAFLYPVTQEEDAEKMREKDIEGKGRQKT